jgi:L-seryl-tRNA(Ser) seleniumtransferase
MTQTKDLEVYRRLGVRPVINAQGNRTVLGGSTPGPEVKAAMDQADGSYVKMQDLLDRSGEAIADLLDVEAAYVTSGCSAALALSAAACMTGDDPCKIAQLPDATGLKSEILIQKAHRYSYDRSFTVPGAKLVEVGTDDACSPEQLDAAIGPDTAAVAFLIRPEEDGSTLSLEQSVEVASAQGVPVIGDAAAQLYPLDYFRRNAQTPDLACFGAKYFGAPHSAGFLCGKKDLVDAASDQGFIAFQENGGRSFGRPMKLDKQEVVGVVTAVERWLTINHEDRLLGYEERLESVQQDLGATAGIDTEIEKVPQYYGSTLNVTFDTGVVGKTAQDIADELDAGTPRVWVSVVDERTLTVTSHALNEGEELVVAERIRTAAGG